jgi:CRP-like cAMP-binding protein
VRPPRDRRLLLWGSAALFLAGWADVSVRNVSETLFLKRIGVDLLPLAFLANGFLLMGTTSLLSLVAGYVDPLRLFTRSLAGLGLVLLLLWALVHVGGSVSYPVLLIAAKQIDAITLISFAVATNALVDPRQAKRLMTPMLAGYTLGSIVGSFASGPLGRGLEVEGLLPVSGGLLLLGALATLPLRRLPNARSILAGSKAIEVRALPDVRAPAISVRALWRESWLFRTLAISALLCGAVGPMLYFQFSYVADMATRGSGGEEKLLALYGQVRGWLQLGVLVSQLWLAPVLYRRIGVALAGTFSPLIYLLGFGGMTLRLGLSEGVAALSAATLQDQAVHDPAQRLLFGLFPENVRGRVTALMEGTAKRAGGCIGNLLVLLAVALGNATWVGVVAIPVTLLWLLATLRIWRGYPSLVLSLATDLRRLSVPGGIAHEIVDAGTLRSLARTLTGPDPGRCRASLEVLRELRPDAAPALLADAIPQASALLRPALLESLEVLLESVRVRPGEHRARVHALASFLRDRPPVQPRERAALVRVLARLQAGANPDPMVVTLLRRAAQDPALVVRVAAEVALYRLVQRNGNTMALRRILGPAVQHEDPDVRAVACLELRALLIEDPQAASGGVEPGGPEWDARLGLLVGALRRADARAAAARAITDVAARHGRAASAARVPMLALAEDPDPGVRAAVLRFIGYARSLEQAGILADRLTAHHPAEAAAAADGLRALGAAALDVLLPKFSSGRRRVRDAIVPLMRELDVGKETFELQLRRELDGVAQRILEIAALDGKAPPILLQRLGERVEDGLHTAFLLLGALHGDDRIVELGDALRLPQTPRERALRIEALEAILLPTERRRLIPFVEDPRLASRLDAASQQLGRRPLSGEATLEALQNDPDTLTRTLLLATLIPTPALGGAGPEWHVSSEVEVLLQLRSFPIFEELTVRELADVARLVHQEQFPAGITIVRQGAYESSMYAITAGRVAIARKDVLLAELGAGEIFGELAVFDGGPHSATVTTLVPTHVLRIEGRDLLALMEELPGIAIAICRTLSRLLRTATVQTAVGARHSPA